MRQCPSRAQKIAGQGLGKAANVNRWLAFVLSSLLTHARWLAGLFDYLLDVEFRLAYAE